MFSLELNQYNYSNFFEQLKQIGRFRQILRLNVLENIEITKEMFPLLEVLEIKSSSNVIISHDGLTELYTNMGYVHVQGKVPKLRRLHAKHAFSFILDGPAPKLKEITFESCDEVEICQISPKATLKVINMENMKFEGKQVCKEVQMINSNATELHRCGLRTKCWNFMEHPYSLPVTIKSRIDAESFSEFVGSMNVDHKKENSIVHPLKRKYVTIQDLILSPKRIKSFWN